MTDTERPPAPHSAQLIAQAESYLAKNYGPIPVVLQRGQGAFLWDVEGKRYTDCLSGYSALTQGHCHPRIVEAAIQQLRTLTLASRVFHHEGMAEFAATLARVTGFPRVLPMNSGAEAVETAVHLCRAATRRQGIVVFDGAYHGRTNLTLAMTSKFGLFKKGYGPFAPEVYRLPFPDLYRRPAEMTREQWVQWHVDRLESGFTAIVDPAHVAAVFIEPVLGEGGFHPAPAPWLRRLRELCDQHGMLLVCDEIQCGMGRTGKLWASEHAGVVPDLLLTAKSLASGLPLSAIVGRADVMQAAHPGGLGGTYSGNPLACVAALASIEAISDPAFLAAAARLGEAIRARLLAIQARHPRHVGDVRGLGSMLAIELVKDPVTREPWPEATQAINAATLQRGLITIRAGLYSNCVRFLPPLDIPDAQLDEAMDALDAAVDAALAGLGVA